MVGKRSVSRALGKMMRTRNILTVGLVGLLLAAPGMAQVPPYSALSAPRSKEKSAPGPIARWLDRVHQRCSCGYGKTHHEFGCTGLQGELVFVFGSCWQFFEEPCFRQPPPRWMDRWGIQPPTPSVPWPSPWMHAP